MRSKVFRSSCAQCVAFFFLAGYTVEATHAAKFLGLGDLAGGTVASFAGGVSANGSVVAGSSGSTSGGEAFRWTSSGMIGLGDLTGGGFQSTANSISADGSVIVGHGLSASGVEAFRWTSGGGMVGLGDLAGGSFQSIANGVSANGSVVVGRGFPISNIEAFRWTSGSGMVGLNDLAGGSSSSDANGVSADGSVVVGFGNSASGIEAFRWTSVGGMVGLGDLAGASFQSTAKGVSADGSVVVGQGDSASGFQAFRWTSGGGMVGLGDLPGGSFFSEATDVSADGSFVVGRSNSASGDEAFFWTQSSGIQSIKNLLSQSVGAALNGWTLTSATAVSADGLTVVGNGINPAGNTEAWLGYLTDDNLVYWFSDTSSDWDSSLSWSGPSLPGPLDFAIIDSSTSITVNGPSANQTVHDLEIGDEDGIGRVALQLSGATSGDLRVTFGTVIWHNSEIVLADSRTFSSSVVSNYGVIRGTGTLSAGLINQDDGELRVASGESLVVVGSSHTNYGKIEAIGGALEFIGPVTNRVSTGLITGRSATLRFQSGLTNNGSLLVSFGTSDVSGDITNSATGKIIVASGGAATFYDDVTQNGTLQVIKVGSTNSVAVFAGAFTGSGGSSGGGDIFFLGDLRPGNSPAIVSFGNNIGFGPTTTLKIELGGTTPGSGYDQVHVAGSLTVGGTLDISLVDLGTGTFAPQVGNSFDILDWVALSGTFDTLLLPTLTGALTWDTSQLYISGVLAVVAPGLPGDYNDDGTVDAADYVVWRKFNNTAFTLPNDSTPGTSPADYTVWRAHFGQTAGSGSRASANSAVPEPTTALILIVEMLMLAMVIRCRKERQITIEKELMMRCVTRLGLKGVALLVAVLVLSTATVATAVTKNSTVVSGTALWSTGSNWSPAGAPGAFDAVNIVFNNGIARTVTYDVADPSIGLLTINLTGAVDAATSTLLLPGNNLTTGGIIVGGYDGTNPTTSGSGTINQSAGTTNTGSSRDLILGYGTGSAGTYTLSGGALVNNLNEYVGFSGTGTFNHSGGTNTINASAAGFFSVGHNAGSTGTYNLSGSGTLSTAADQFIGFDGGGTFNQTGGANNASEVLVLGLNGGGVGGFYNLSGGSLFVESATSVGRRGFGVFNQTGGTHDTSTLNIAEFSSSTGGTYTLSGGSAAVVGNAYVGGRGGAFGGAGVLTVSGTGVLTVGEQLRVYDRLAGTSLNLSGGTINTAALDLTGTPSKLNWTAGTLNLTSDVTWDSAGATPTSVAFGAALALGANRTLMVTGNETLGGTGEFDLTLNGGSAHIVTGDITISPNGDLTLIGGSLSTGNLVNNGTFNFIAGTLEITGGSISGLSSLAIPINSELRASGVQSLRIIGVAGSTITATGNLTLGNAAAVNGFGTQGTLQVGANSVTLLDANDVIFDSLSLATLGNAGSPGTLTAANGLTLDFGGNVAGFGTVSTPNNVAKPLINNGHITGNSVAEKITLTGYVKGVGTFDNVNFTGTFSPGLSSASLIVGNVALSPTSTLIMEIGGTAPGGGYDQLLSSGALAFDSTLLVSLINGFSPAAGQSFNQFDWITMSGAFDTLQLPALSGSLVWDTTQLYTTGVLSINASGLAGDYNQNGTVDAADYVVWRNTLAQTGTGLAADGNANNMIDDGDYIVWRAHFGQTAASGAGAAASAALPEPEALVLLGLALPALALSVRRRS